MWNNQRVDYKKSAQYCGTISPPTGSQHYLNVAPLHNEAKANALSQEAQSHNIPEIVHQMLTEPLNLWLPLLLIQPTDHRFIALFSYAYVISVGRSTL